MTTRVLCVSLAMLEDFEITTENKDVVEPMNIRNWNPRICRLTSCDVLLL